MLRWERKAPQIRLGCLRAKFLDFIQAAITCLFVCLFVCFENAFDFNL